MKRIIPVLTSLLLCICFSGCVPASVYKNYDAETNQYKNSYIDDSETQRIADPIMDTLLECIKTKSGEAMKKHFALGYAEKDIDYTGSFNNLCAFLDGDITSCIFDGKWGGGNHRDGGKIESTVDCSYTLITDKNTEYTVSLSICIVDEIEEDETGIVGFLLSRSEDEYNNIDYDSDCAFPIRSGLTDEELTEHKHLMDDIVRCLSKKDTDRLRSFFTSEAIASGDAFDKGITYSMNTYNGDILYDEDEYTHNRTYHTDIRFTVEEKGDGAGQTKKVNCYYEVETTEGTFIIFIRNVLVRREKTDWEKVTGVEYLQVISSDDIKNLNWNNDSIGIYTQET